MARKKAKALPPKMITVYAEILQETDDAILVRCDEDADGVWLPKSQINYDGERGDESVEIEIPDWLADEKGFYDGMGEPGPVAPEAPAETAQPETVILVCSVTNYVEVNDGTAKQVEFTVGHEREAGSFNPDEEDEYYETSHVIPLDQVLAIELDDDELDKITVPFAYALEQGLAQPELEADEEETPPAA